MATTEAAHPVVADLIERLGSRCPKDRLTAIRAFARAYLRRLPDDVVESMLAEELVGHVLGIFELVDGRRHAPAVLRAFTPGLANDGYAAVGSVVETNCVDSPFLVDSVTNAIQAHGVGVRLVIHPLMGIERDARGSITAITAARHATNVESVMHFELALPVDPGTLERIEDSVREALADVQDVVGDHQAMRERTAAMADVARAGGKNIPADEAAEAGAFLDWLLEENFVLLGYREYVIKDDAMGVVKGSGLGILREETSSNYSVPIKLSALRERVRNRLDEGELLVVAKTERMSTVHRRARMDYIGVKTMNRQGKVNGEIRLLGLFTARATTEPASRIPILRRKLAQLLEGADLLEGSHDYKAAVALFESYPTDTLFATSADALRAEITSLIDLQERAHIRVFLRQLDADRHVVLVAMPRDRYDATLRKRLQDVLQRRLGASSVEAHVDLGAADQARLHFIIHTDGKPIHVPVSELEVEIVQTTRTWDDRLRERLIMLHGETRGTKLAERYSTRLPDHYKNTTDVYLSVLDIQEFERLDASEILTVALQNERTDGDPLTRVGLYHRYGKIRLSQVVPFLEHLGLQVIEEVPTRLVGSEVYLHDFGVLGPDDHLIDVAADGRRISEAIVAAWRGELESDGLQRLVVVAGLAWHEVAILRAYRKYRQRVAPTFTETYEHDAFARHAAITRNLVALFNLRFDPAVERDEAAEAALHGEILAQLDAVRALDDDRILRSQLGLIDATVRTNAFVPGRPYLSFKIDSARVPDMPKPFPLWEIFVYSPLMEGIHLRGGRVARGGIRWSDRREDFRTEVLGLMKAQMVKNAVIVPVGSKGGFVLKHPPTDRDALRDDVRLQYSVLVRGLLDLTDNLVGGVNVSPPNVRVLDGPDPYLVVAADKGTATFSDLANSIAEEYGFWLADAFASGGSAGYDHKGLAITARGAWESVKRHFREVGRDVATDPFTVVGVGDMSGDVFGNGMLLSEQIRLVAAFDHRHIFIDPDPDPASTFSERKRLFDLAGSSWDDYDRTLISAGGGIYPLTDKSIELSIEARAALGVDTVRLTPTELKAVILRAPVDLLWNGGIGTYVKASDETHAEVGDRANDAIRANGRDLRCKVVAEGGNLGLTQRGRIEYAEAGGRINTDAVDNSAGVDCSDHEVNIKILLGIPMASGDLTRKQRDALLEEMSDEVCSQVLYDNYQQVQIISQTEAITAVRNEAHIDLMRLLEGEGILDREIEELPRDDEIMERGRSGGGLTRPELSVLMAYSKRSLKDAILESDLPDDPYLEGALRSYFPQAAVERFGDLVGQHPLRRELIATIVANEVVNAMGISFPTRLAAETGAGVASVARSYWAAREIANAVDRWTIIEGLDYQIPWIVQDRLMTRVDNLVEDIARWVLLAGDTSPLADTIAEYRGAFAEIAAAIDTTGSPEWRARHLEAAAEVESLGVDPDLARDHGFLPELAHAPDIAEVAEATGRPLIDVAAAFFLVGEQLHIDRLETMLASITTEGRWDRWAALAMGDDLMALRRDLAQRALERAEDGWAGDGVKRLAADRADAFSRIDRLFARLDAEPSPGVSSLAVAVRQLRGASAA